MSERRPLGLRVWHWASAFVVLMILSTVLLRKTFLSARAMSGVIARELGEQGVAVTEDAAKVAARAIRDGMWEWHYRLGFVLAGLFVFRWVFGKFRFPGFRSLRNASHSVFYLIVAFMAVTGLGMYYSSALGIPDEWVDSVVEVHEAGQWFFFCFVPLHIAGMVIAELRGERGILSRMVHGGGD